MKANELRIGNWVKHNNCPTQIQSIDSDWEGVFIGVLATHNDEQWHRMSHRNDGEIAPIPLTEPWLKLFGFTAGSDGYYFRGGVEYNPATYTLAGFGYCEIKYVHQLQNLYFALTGKEVFYGEGLTHPMPV